MRMLCVAWSLIIRIVPILAIFWPSLGCRVSLEDASPRPRKSPMRPFCLASFLLLGILDIHHTRLFKYLDLLGSGDLKHETPPHSWESWFLTWHHSTYGHQASRNLSLTFPLDWGWPQYPSWVQVRQIISSLTVTQRIGSLLVSFLKLVFEYRYRM